MALEGNSAAVQTPVGISDIEGSGLELRCGLCLHPRGMAPLNLTATIL
jgi:hypothetical protein